MIIEVCYALSQEQQIILSVEVASKTTVLQAIQQSGILEQFPDLSIFQMKIGIFSQLVELDHFVNQGDRIELYRPIQCDPKQKRRERAALKKKQLAARNVR